VSGTGRILARGALLGGGFAAGVAGQALLRNFAPAALHFGPYQKGVAIFNCHCFLAYDGFDFLYLS
jgi:hypothetical protein